MAETQSTPARSRPTWLLWLLVIAFGAFYLNAMRERGIGEDAIEQAQRAGAPALATGEAPQGSETMPAAASGEPAPARIAASGRSEPQQMAASDVPQEALEPRDSLAQSTPAHTTERASERASLAGSSPASAIPVDVPDEAPSPAPVEASGPSRVGPPASPAEAGWPGSSDRTAVAERRARLLAEYDALWRSVEAERRRIWDEMNRLGRGYSVAPYPVPYPFSDLPRPRHGDLGSPP